MVEFALIGWMFFLMLFGIMEMGRLMWMNHELANGTREASRIGMVRGAEACKTITPTEQELVDAIINHSTGISEDDLAPLVHTPFCGEPGTTTFVIETQYEFTPMLGIIPGLGSIDLSARSEVIVQH